MLNTLNISRPTPRRILAAISPVLIALTMVLALMHYSTGGRVAYTMDSLTYRDAALNFIAGHPMQVTNVMTQAPERQPLLVWPPAYPALWASVASLGNADIDDVPSLLNPVLLGITTLTIFWVCWMITGRLVIACIVAIMSAFAPPSMIVYGHAWSETLFIPLLLLAYAAFWKYRISREKFIWLAAAAIFIGIANWVRYAGVAFLPILGFSVLAASGAVFGKRILHASGATLLSVALVSPLWFRNWQLAGNISGSTRGGVAGSDRWIQDTATIFDLFEHSLFAFSYMLRANLEIPLILAAIFVAIGVFRRHGVRWLRPTEIWLPIVWLTGYLLFLLYARMLQKIDMDMRMLAVAPPFLLLAITPAVNAAFSGRSFELRKILIIFLLGLLIYSGLNEADRTHENYASAGEPRWRANYAQYYLDMRNTSPASHALQESIGPIHPSTLILTDYRALYIRYLTGALAYSPYTGKDCADWTVSHAEGLILIRSPELPPWAIGCLKENSQWRLLRPN